MVQRRGHLRRDGLRLPRRADRASTRPTRRRSSRDQAPYRRRGAHSPGLLRFALDSRTRLPRRLSRSDRAQAPPRKPLALWHLLPHRRRSPRHRTSRPGPPVHRVGTRTHEAALRRGAMLALELGPFHLVRPGDVARRQLPARPRLFPDRPARRWLEAAPRHLSAATPVRHRSGRPGPPRRGHRLQRLRQPLCAVSRRGSLRLRARLSQRHRQDRPAVPRRLGPRFDHHPRHVDRLSPRRRGDRLQNHACPRLSA